MKIAIIGYGFVGQALRSVIKSTEDILIFDPAQGYDFEGGIRGLISHQVDIVFLCLPTPTVDGKCDDSIVLNYVEDFKDWPGCLVVKSTIPPHTVEKINSIRPSTVIWPELLREEHASRDIQWPEIIVVGAPSRMQFNFVEHFIKFHTKISWEKGQHPHAHSRIRHVKPIEASIFKYATNSFLATKTLFFHQMKMWMEERGSGDSYEMVTKLLGEEGRVGSSHMQAPGVHGFGYDGSCFPKDVKALLGQVYHDDKTTFPLLNEVDVQNEQLRKSHKT